MFVHAEHFSDLTLKPDAGLKVKALPGGKRQERGKRDIAYNFDRDGRVPLQWMNKDKRSTLFDIRNGRGGRFFCRDMGDMTRSHPLSYDALMHLNHHNHHDLDSMLKMMTIMMMMMIIPIAK